MAIQLFSSGDSTLQQAARFSSMSLESFISLLGECGIDAVDYPTDELDSDLENALVGLKRLSLWAQQQVVDCIEFMKAL